MIALATVTVEGERRGNPMQTMPCPRCGADTPNHPGLMVVEFCNKCGAALSQAELAPHSSAEPGIESSVDHRVTGRRVVAALIDLTLLILLFLFMAAASGNVGGWSVSVEDGMLTAYSNASTREGGDATGYAYVFLALSYYIVMERVWAATLGKMIMGLTVVKVGGGLYGWKPVLLRNIFRIIDGLPIFYLLGFVFVAATPRNQRLGDFAAGALVVRRQRVVRPQTS